MQEQIDQILTVSVFPVSVFVLPVHVSDSASEKRVRVRVEKHKSGSIVDLSSVTCARAQVASW